MAIAEERLADLNLRVAGAAVLSEVPLGADVAGVAGAPKIGSKDDWETRMQAGMDAMVASVVNGKGIMPPRGGGDFSAEEIAAAINDMLANSGM